MFFDYALMVTAILLSLTVVTTMLYYRRIRLASRAYEEARNVVGDIIISFDKQLQRQEERIGTAIQKIETVTAKSERLSKRFEEQESNVATRLADLAAKVDSKAARFLDQESLKNDIESLRRQLEGLAEAQEELKQREAEAAASDSQVETPIPIKKERALAPLTETELRVLEFIATEGEKTAPQLKDFIRLSREHTARLMKKLYEGGYVERRSEKTPYTYRVKEEMLRILKKSDVKV